VAPPELTATAVGKRFGSLIAPRRRLDPRLRPGHLPRAARGETAPGKSTLVKCIMGYYQADEGRITMGRRDRRRQKNPREAAGARGVGMVYQHFTPGREHDGGGEPRPLAGRAPPFSSDWKREQDELRAFMKRNCRSRSIPCGRCARWRRVKKQKLEILKQLYLGSRIMILDEPTSVLTPGRGGRGPRPPSAA